MLIRLSILVSLLALDGISAWGGVPCPSGGQVTEFQLDVEPAEGGEKLPITQVHKIPRGSKLHYHPGLDQKSKGEVALLVVPPGQTELIVLEGKPDSRHAVWTLPVDAELIGLVYGARGFDEAKVKSFVAREPEMLAQLASYAEKTIITERLLADVRNGPGSADAFAATLQGLASRQGGAAWNKSAPLDQQTAALFMTLNPSLGSYDPLSTNTEARIRQSTSLAASIGSMFFGSTFGLGAGGANLVLNLRSMAFPDTEFRSAFAQMDKLKGYTLCGKKDLQKQRTKLAYLWMSRVDNENAPALSIMQPSHHLLMKEIAVPLGGDPASPNQIRGVRQWWLTSAAGAKFPVAVASGTDGKDLRLKLPPGKMAAGNYRLTGSFDWQTLKIPGEVVLHDLPSLKNARVSTSTAATLVAGKGAVPVEMEGADFRFIEKIRVRNSVDPLLPPIDLAFQQKRGKLKVTVDTQSLAAGNYAFDLMQPGGIVAMVPFAVLDPGPKPGIGVPRFSPAGGLALELREGEIAMQGPFSLVLPVKGVGNDPSLEMRCEPSPEKMVKPGDTKFSGLRFSLLSASEWFITADPKLLGNAGCMLQATVVDGNAGRSAAVDLGRLVSLPVVDRFELTEERTTDSLFAGTLWGTELERIERTGWEQNGGVPVSQLPTPDAMGKQSLKVALPWPAPSPHAPLYVWLRGETSPRRTNARL